MQDERFEWDDDKAASNLAKHKIGFDDAQLVFDDPGSLDEPDDSMDYGEQRFKSIGMANARLIVVFYTLRDERVRIISARRPSRKEQQDYARENRPF